MGMERSRHTVVQRSFNDGMAQTVPTDAKSVNYSQQYIAQN